MREARQTATALLLLSCLMLTTTNTAAFHASSPLSTFTARTRPSFPSFLRMATTFSPTREKTQTDRKTSRRPWKEENDVGRRRNRPIMEPGTIGGPLEYLQDDTTISREPTDPFHILLLGMTYENPRVTVSYVAGTLGYVLLMPETDAMEHAEFAKEEGMSVLGTWTREECLDLGAQLVVRDLVCRVVPGTPAGRQGWQAKGDASVWDVPSIPWE